jgi:hypothetical protein
MNLTTQTPSFDEDEKRIRELLQEAGDCHVAPSAEHIASVREVLTSRMQKFRPASLPLSPPLSRRAWLKYTVGGVAAASVVIATSSLFRPPDLWAQVVEAMGTQPWIHGATKDAQGQPQEFWLSVPRRIYALRHGQSAIYSDYRTGEQDSYIADQHLLVRMALSDKGPFQRLATFYTTTIQGEPKPGDIFGKGRVQKQTQRTVHDGGRTWIEFEWTLASAPQEPAQVAVMRVDPDTRLPVFLLLQRGTNQPLRFTFDFPQTGPADAYALGVPRDAHVENRLPSPEGERAVLAGEAGRKDLDNYFAVVYGTDSPIDPTDVTSIHLVWRKGDKWRLEYCVHGEHFPKLPPAGVDLLGWWRTQLTHLVCIPSLVCDGRQIFSNQVGRAPHENEKGSVPENWQKLALVRPNEDHAEIARAYGQNKMIEVMAYPQIAPTGRSVTEKGSPKRLFEADGPVALRTKVWLDPTHGFAAVRKQNDFVDAPFEVARVYESSDFRQTTRGFWYPTTVRSKSLPKPGTRKIADVVNHFLIDFNTELPESLFTPSARP